MDNLSDTATPATDRTALARRIVDVLAGEFEIERAKLVPEARLVEDLDLDSIDAIDLIVRIQQETDLKVSADDFKAIRTLGDVTDTIARLAAAQTAVPTAAK